jgi:hypothetical protein
VRDLVAVDITGAAGTGFEGRFVNLFEGKAALICAGIGEAPAGGGWGFGGWGGTHK